MLKDKVKAHEYWLPWQHSGVWQRHLTWIPPLSSFPATPSTSSMIRQCLASVPLCTLSVPFFHMSLMERLSRYSAAYACSVFLLRESLALSSMNVKSFSWMGIFDQKKKTWEYAIKLSYIVVKEIKCRISQFSRTFRKFCFLHNLIIYISDKISCSNPA